MIDGIDKLSSLPRGTEALGFYKDGPERADRSVRLASEMPAGERPTYRGHGHGKPDLRAYLQLRANRHDDFYIRPAGGVDLCNVQVPVRKKTLSSGGPGVMSRDFVLNDNGPLCDRMLASASGGPSSRKRIPPKPAR